MKNKGKRFLTYFMALSLMCWGVCGNSVFAGYVAPDSYSTIVDGNGTGEKRMFVSGQKIDSYHFQNIRHNPEDYVNGGALDYAASYSGFNIDNSLFENNYASLGGAIRTWGSSPTVIRNTKFFSNTADNGGGAIYATKSIQLDNSLFESNKSGLRGGAIFFAPDASDSLGRLTLNNVDFINNIAGQDGGAIYFNAPNAVLDSSINVNDGQTHYMSGNMQNTQEDEYGTRKASANAIYINSGGVKLSTTGSVDSKLVIDDGIEGANIANANLKITANGGEIALNNEIKNLILTHQSGTLLLNANNKLADGASILNNVDLIFKPANGNDIRFDLANGKLDNLLIRNLSITEPTGDQKLLIALDVDLNQGKSDFFNVSGTTTGSLKFDADHFELNIINDGSADKFQLISSSNPNFLSGELIQFYEDGKYKFTIGEDGFINVTKEDTSGLPEAVASDEAIRNYIATKNIKLTQSLNAMGGESLTIDMKNFNLDGNKNQGITLAADQRLEIKNAGSIKGGALSNFYTDSNGAVVNNIGGTVTITDSTIANNTSDGKGGAIYALGGAVVLNADTKDVILKNNVHEAAVQEVNPDVPEAPDQPDITQVTTANDTQAAGSKNDIYLENASDGTKATLTVNGSKNTIVESGIAGNGDITKNDAGVLKLGGDNSKFTGDVYLNGGEVQLLSGATYFNAQNTHVKNNSRINLANNNPNDVVNFGNLNLDGTAKLGIDIDAKNSLNDKIGALSVTGDGKILIDNINIMSTTNGAVQFDVITLDEATNDSPLLGLVELSPEAKNVMSPIFKYQADFDSNTGVMSLSTGSRGNKNSYNPSILATPVALQAAAQAGIKEAVNYAFEHTDSFTKLPRNERFARVNADKYAISEFNGQLPLYNGQSEGSAFWFRPFTVFESIDLDRGPKVDNLSYGTLIGFDSRFKERRHGWTSLTSSFLGYHGSSLDYGNVDIMSNGALVGITKNYYKKNFWTALSMTGNVGIGEISEMYGDDNIVSLSGAVSSKTGYNMEFNEGKFIIQPNVSLSYYISKIFDYTNEAGVRINSDPLNAFEIKPGIRLIGNTEGGWQPYISAAFVWNTFNDTDVRANGIKLPEMSMDPYVEYGLGIQRVLNNDFTCYLQSLVRNGGRTGVSLTGGMSWAVGRVNRGRVHL